MKEIKIEPSPVTTSLSPAEKETIILYNQEESTAKVCTYHKALCNKLIKAYQKRPDLVTIVKLYDDGYGDFIVPKKWIKVNGGSALRVDTNE